MQSKEAGSGPWTVEVSSVVSGFGVEGLWVWDLGLGFTLVSSRFDLNMGGCSKVSCMSELLDTIDRSQKKTLARFPLPFNPKSISAQDIRELLRGLG